jgi:archaellum biogenesis ATPase FlaH
VIPFLRSDYFADRSERILFNTISDFFKEYNSLPTSEILRIDLNKDNNLSETDIGLVGELVNSISKEDDINQDWLLQETENFCQEKAVYNAVLESIQILDDGSKDKDKGSIPKLLSDALAVSFDSHVGHDYLEDSEERFGFYHRKENHFAFDLDYLNKITDGGLLTKTLNVFMGGPGAGKTLVMCHLASWYLTQGKNVLYITLEMSEERISERIDANLLNTPLKDLAELPKSMYDKKVERIRNKTTGKLIIKEYPTAQAGVGHFRHLVNELAMKKSFSPDIIIVDYINICTSSRIKPGGNINSYTYIKSIAEELRGFAVEQVVPLITATQVNREGFGNSDIGMENTAESFGLPATADLFLALITSEELEALNQIMIKQLKNRYNDPTIHRRFVVGVDRTKMRLYDVDQSAQKDIAPEDIPMMDQSTIGQRISKERRDFSGVIV